MTVILYTPKFVRLYKKLPLKIQQAAEQKEIIFRKDPFTPSLKTHKLTGELEGLFAFSIDYSHRIIFEFRDTNTVSFRAIGNHDVYK
jgi:mRNA-degrading endonuclease YafQ of YafQ-DinJ toxin-antitoxin module